MNTGSILDMLDMRPNLNTDDAVFLKLYCICSIVTTREGGGKLYRLLKLLSPLSLIYIFILEYFIHLCRLLKLNAELRTIIPCYMKKLMKYHLPL